MADSPVVSLLCVEDDVEWQERVRHAANSRGGIHVVVAGDFVTAREQLAASKFDVVTLDSRLPLPEESAPTQPRMHQLIAQAKRKSSEAALVALTAYSDTDISRSDRGLLVDVIEKGDVQDDIVALKQRLLQAIYHSLCAQARLLWRECGREPPVANSDLLFVGLQSASDDGRLDADVRLLLDKYYNVFLDHHRNLPITLLNCTGYVERVARDEVTVVLYISQEEKRHSAFSADRFIAAGLFYENACFRYVVVRSGAMLTSIVEPLERPGDNRAVDSTHLSVFDEFRVGDMKQ